MESIIKFSSQPEEYWITYNPDGSRYIPINTVEDILDNFKWSTKNFHFQLFKDGYANIIVAASIELIIDDNGKERSFVGGANLSIKSIEPNTHYIATVKSECIKNAASDIGKLFGRHLNDEIENKRIHEDAHEKKLSKLKPDSLILRQFLKAIEDKDQATMTMLENIYELKIPTE